MPQDQSRLPTRSTTRRDRQSFRPTLETLEGRAMPAGLTGDDRFENNDTQETAYGLGTIARQVNLTGLRLNDSADWFSFRTRGVGATNDRVSIVSDSPRNGMLQLSVYDAAGNLVGGTGVRTQDHLSVKLSALPAGVYFVEVAATEDAPGIGYSLQIDSPVRSLRDPQDGGANDTQATATGLGTLTRVRNLHTTGQLPVGDQDWYRFALNTSPTGGRAILTSAAHRNNPLALGLYDAAGHLLRLSSGPSTTQGVSLAGLTPGTYYLRVTSDGGAAPTYTLRASLPAQQPAAAHALATSVSTGDSAFYRQFQTPALRSLVRTDMQDGQLSRTEWIGTGGIFDLVEGDGKVTAAEFADLKLILRNASALDGSDSGQTTPVKMYDYVLNLADKVVNGDPANGTYQGKPFGNLQAGSGATRLQNLVNKWFLGLDRPATSPDDHTQLVYAEAATNPLFAAGGPAVDDINQGDAGDCYFLSSVGTILTRQLDPSSGVAIPAYFSLYDPAAGTNPDGLFIANYDDATDPTLATSWAVRFYYQDGTKGEWVADYVTVDRYFPTLPTSGGGAEWNYANAFQDFSDASIPLWVALVEKAYAQQNASQRWSAPAADQVNSYSAIGGLYYGNQALMQLTGQSGYLNTTDLSTLTFADVVAAFENGVGVVFGTMTSPPVDPTSNGHLVEHPLVSNHDYMMVGYDTTDQTILLRNPWGSATLSGTYDSANPPTEAHQTDLFIKATIAFLQENFDGYYHLSSELIPASE